MKKILLIAFCTTLLITAASAGANRPLANENKTGLYARSIEQVLRLSPDDIDLATAVLIISEQWSDNVQGRKYQTMIDDMAAELRKRLDEKTIPLNHQAIPVINDYLFNELGFKSDSDSNNPDNLFLDTVLDNKRGYCLSLSVLYLAMGERLGLPLYGVVVPTHFFVRYDDGRVRFNIEATSKGGYANDKHYIDKFKIPPGNSGIYLQNLDKRQTLGCFFNNLGNSYSSAGNTKMALAAFETAVEINPLLPESRTNLGNIYLKLERTDDAISQYKAALEINEDDSKTHNNLGNAYLKKGSFDDAVSEYSRSIRLESNFVDAYKGLAYAYSKQDMFSQALSSLKDAAVLAPKDSDIYTLFGDIYCRTDDYDEAIHQYKKALDIKPDLSTAYYGLGLCYNKLDQPDDEIKAYRKALSIDPQMTAALINLGNAYFNKKKYDSAVEEYKKAARLKPDSGTIHYNIAAAYHNKGYYDKAAVEYEKAIELDPQMADAHNGLAFAYYKLKDYESAWQHIKKAEFLGAKISPDLLSAIKENLP